MDEAETFGIGEQPVALCRAGVTLHTVCLAKSIAKSKANYDSNKALKYKVSS